MNLVICVKVTTVFGWVRVLIFLVLCVVLLVFCLFCFACLRSLSCVANDAGASIFYVVYFQQYFSYSMQVSFTCKTKYSEIATDLTN